VKEVVAAAGVKIAAPALEGAVAGAGLYVVKTPEEEAAASERLVKDLEAVRIATDKVGILVKADTLGSLEALVGYIRDHEVPIRRADIGDISKKEVIEVSTVAESDPLLAVILAFNSKVLPDANTEASALKVPIFQSRIIYELVEQYEAWVADKRKEQETALLETVTFPGKIELLPGYVFRQSNPAVVGIRILGGRVQPKTELITPANRHVGTIQQIQDKGNAIPVARMGAEVAISIKGATVGRQINEGDILYIDVPEKMAIRLNRELQDTLTSDELDVLHEFLEIKRKQVQPFWGV
jgi:translation initiation factor 5B